MADTYAISALTDKRARIDGEIQARRFQIMRLECELAHIDAVIKMFSPSYDISKIATKRSFSKNPAGTPRGSGSREALTILREVNEPLTSMEIAIRVLAKQGREDTPESRGMLANTIHSTFSRRRDGAVILDASQYPAKWSLARR
ncbi:hypothetical protein [Novosphingobium sp. PASSN1]|uniref:hypothetical protein n=1 Tax=Novosphingobium sp. PASSN1 TaxID=2015561 RepID=UPI000BC6580A|nr:hypothetical protein [Novosphingobium sp. PASSN1]OYU36561.1 MAG: hypothetical protein CFE35_04615 [Novosphingobium sp. PASSN1]